MDIYSLIGILALVLVCGFALWRGDKLEQTAAIAFGLGSIVGLFVQQDAGVLTPKLIWFAIDFTLMATLAVIGWRSHRSWPMFATAFQAIAVLTHVASLLNLQIGSFAYISAIAISAYGVMATLAVGTWHAWREREALSFIKS